MNRTGRAFFVDFPRIMEDLKALHDINAEQDFEIVATVKLGAIDFENFVTDMVADRQFIEDNCDLCSVGGVWKCLLVQQKVHVSGESPPLYPGIADNDQRGYDTVEHIGYIHADRKSVV